MSANIIPTTVANKVNKTNVFDVKLVTICGKQVEVTYETTHRRVDIYGLHTRDRDRRPANNGYKSYKTGDRKLFNGRQSTDSNKSTDESTKGSVPATPKGPIDRALRRLEAAKRTDPSVDRIANRLMKEKERVKTGNRFDTLSSGADNDPSLASNTGVTKKAAKQTKRKKSSTTSQDDTSAIISSRNSNGIACDNREPDVQHSRPNNLRSVSKSVDTYSDRMATDLIYDVNNYQLNNYYNNIDDNHDKCNDKILGIGHKPQNNLIYGNVKNINNGTDNYLIPKVSHEFSVNQKSVPVDTSAIYKPTVHTVQNGGKSKLVDKYSSNGALSLKSRKNFDDKSRSKPRPLERQLSDKVVAEEVEGSAFHTGYDYQLMARYAAIIIAFGIFLTIYTIAIISHFCKC